MHTLPSLLKKVLISSFLAIMLGINASAIAVDDSELGNNPEGFKRTAKQVIKVMDKWARSWARLDAVGYISCYSPDYIGKGFPSHFAWAASRQHRLQNQKDIKLSLSDVQLMSTRQGFFNVTFTQHYKSDTYQDVTRKQLEFKLIDGQWYIVAEKNLASK